MEAPTVFISYSHDSREHVDLVLDFSNQLRQDGIDCILDQYETAPAEGWIRWMDKHIRNCDFVIMVCTHTYYQRVMGEERAGKGQGVRWEGNLIYQHIYNADTTNVRFIPVLFKSGKFEHIPTPLQSTTYYHIDTEEGYEDLYRRLTNQPRVEKPELGKLRALAARRQKQDFLALEKTTINKSDLRVKMVASFSLEDLRTLCADIAQALRNDNIELPLSPDIVGGDGIEGIILALIDYLDRRGHLDYLVGAVRKARPGIVWGE